MRDWSEEGGREGRRERCGRDERSVGAGGEEGGERGADCVRGGGGGKEEHCLGKVGRGEVGCWA